MKILNFGSCNIDTVYEMDHITMPGETNAANSVASFPGGKGLNQSIALAKAGVSVFHAGCIGTDGGMLREVMESHGIDLTFLKTTEEKTGHAIIQVSGTGENAIVIFKGANDMITRSHIDHVLLSFSAGDYLLVQNEISELPYLIDKAAQIGMRIVLNPSPYHNNLNRIDLRKVSYIILNELEAVSLFGSQNVLDIRHVLETLLPNVNVMLTLGKKGSVYITSKNFYRQNAFCVDTVDTTAAGDTFTGYFIAGIASGKHPRNAMRYASAASALAVSKKGAASSIPTISEVEQRLPELMHYPLNYTSDTKEAVLRFLENHYVDGTLKQLSAQLGYSPSYTSNWLINNIGMTFTDLMQQKKCEVSAKLLADTDLSVSNIISAVGYKNESYFRRIFHQKYNCTPLNYRNKSRNEK